jgi:peroxiredoxin
MKIKLLSVIIIVLFVFTSCNQAQHDSKTFSLKGKIEGSNTEYVVLHYFDSSNAYVADTLQIKNGSFTTKGHLINTQMVSLSTNLTGRSIEDPNHLMFFLEPNEVDVMIKEGQFAKAKISGSKTQIEKENLDKLIKPLNEKFEHLKLKRESLDNSNKENGNDDYEKEIENLNAELRKIQDELRSVKLRYSANNPKSYLSASIIDIYKRRLSLDSVKALYTKLDPIIKESSYGLRIKDQIRVVNSGDVAPNFSQEDINGNILSLNQFKGKTVLLDFGAKWCIPCVKNHPEIKRMYDKFHSIGFEIIGISLDVDKFIWKENVKKEKLNWYHVYEGRFTGKAGSISRAYSVQPVPAYILIDKNGIIVDRYSGADNDNKGLTDLEEKLNFLKSSK